MAVAVELHPHARERADERGATEPEITATIEGGERFPARLAGLHFGETSSSMACGVANNMVQSKSKPSIAVEESRRWLVITVLVKYF